MPSLRPASDQFSGLLRKLALAAAVIVCVVVVMSVVSIARQYDNNARQSSYLMIKSGLNALITANERIATDYTSWTDAFEAVAARDIPWIERNMGAGAASNEIIHALIISGGGLPDVLGWADAGGAYLGAEDFAAFSAAGKALVERAGKRPEDPPVSDFIRLGDTLWVMAVNCIHPHDRALDPSEETAFLVSAVRIDQDATRQFQKLFLIEDIAITLSSVERPDRQALPLVSAAGETLGYLTWPIPRPGSNALRGLAMPIGVALMSVLLALWLGARVINRFGQRFERALVAAEAADKTKSEFIASLSHELRTPMNGIVGMLELLQLEDLTETQRELVAIAYGSAETQVEMIDHLLAFGQIESGNMQLTTGPFEPAALIREVVALARTGAREKGLQLELHCEGYVENVLLGDRLAIRQIAVNLIGNAIKFTNEGKVTVDLIVSSDLSGHHFCLAVTDSGPGIRQADIERIFEHFVQADSAATRRISGVGLGLAISQKLATAMNGKITVDSTVGSGSTFVFDVVLEASRTQSDQQGEAA